MKKRIINYDLWGNPDIRKAKYWVFHDESIPNKQWLLIGLLFVPDIHLDEIRNVLKNCRRNENYWGEIHFSELPRSFNGKWGGKARVASQWLKNFEIMASEDKIYFTVLAIDRYSPKYEYKRFKKDFHAYNRFTAMALKAGIAWHLGPKQLYETTIYFISDKKDRATRPDEGIIDNFEEYLPYRAELDSFLTQLNNPNYPYINLKLKLEDSAKEDLLQYCDILLGATQMALVAGSSRPTKKELGRMVAKWYQDVRKPPWKQEFNLHRKFNLWLFPDKYGAPSEFVPIKLLLQDGEPKLF